MRMGAGTEEEVEPLALVAVDLASCQLVGGDRDRIRCECDVDDLEG